MPSPVELQHRLRTGDVFEERVPLSGLSDLCAGGEDPLDLRRVADHDEQVVKRPAVQRKDVSIVTPAALEQRRFAQQPPRTEQVAG
jgi:hypothetical protein